MSREPNLEQQLLSGQYRPTRELRDLAIDRLAFYHWKHQGEEWVDGVESVDVAPDRLRGPFSWERLFAYKQAR